MKSLPLTSGERNPQTNTTLLWSSDDINLFYGILSIKATRKVYHSQLILHYVDYSNPSLINARDSGGVHEKS